MGKAMNYHPKTTAFYSKLWLGIAVGMVPFLSGCNLSFVMSDGYIFTRTGEIAEASEMGSFEDGIEKISIINLHGNVNIEPAGAEGKPTWMWKKKVWADSVESASILIDELKIDVRVDGETQTWEVFLPPKPDSIAENISADKETQYTSAVFADLNGVESNLTLMIPLDVEVEVTNKHGDVEILKIEEDVELENRHGNIRLESLSGSLTVGVAHGNVEGSDLGHSVFDIQHGGAKIGTIDGDLEMKLQHGNVKIENVSGDASVKSQHGNFSATVGGEVRVSNAHGDTQIQLDGEVAVVTSQHGEIKLVVGNQDFREINLQASHDDIHLQLPENSKANITMEASHGDKTSSVESDKGSDQTVILKTQHGDIQVK
jgi:hypothetical protein